MPGLMDIASTPARVEVRGTMVDVFGVSAEGVAYLLSNFPEIKALFSGKDVSFDTETIVTKAPKALAAIIAAGTGQPGNPEAEAVAASLGVDEQAELLAKIVELTFPRGIGPFAEAVNRLAAAATGGASSDAITKAAASTLRSPSKN